MVLPLDTFQEQLADMTTMDAISLGAAAWLLLNATKHGKYLSQTWLGFRCGPCLGLWVGLLVTLVLTLISWDHRILWGILYWVPNSILGSYLASVLHMWFRSDALRKTFTEAQLAEALGDD